MDKLYDAHNERKGLYSILGASSDFLKSAFVCFCPGYGDISVLRVRARELKSEKHIPYM